MSYTFSIMISDDHGEEMTYEEYNEEKTEKVERIISKLDTLKGNIEDLFLEEEEFRENMPEDSSDTELLEFSQIISNNLEDALSNLEECVSSLKDIL